MADQPQEDESQDNAGTGAEISTENDAPAHFYDVPVDRRGRVLPPHYLKSFSVFGWSFGPSEGRPLTSGVGGVSSQQSCSLHFRPQHCGPFAVHGRRF